MKNNLFQCKLLQFYAKETWSLKVKVLRIGIVSQALRQLPDSGQK